MSNTTVFWSKDRLKQASDALLVLHTYPAVAAELSSQWGFSLSPSSVRHALTTHCPAVVEKAKVAKADHDKALASSYDPLPDTYLMTGSGFNKQKKQEYNKNMGKFAEAIRTAAHGGEVDENLQKNLSGYISNLAEDEERWIERRRARILSISEARDTLARRHFVELARNEFTGLCKASGYAAKTPKTTVERMLTLHLSDLHVGAILKATDSPSPFGSLEESRRLAHVVSETCDFKTKYRDHTSLNLLLNGDLLQGRLQHQLVDGQPVPQQQVALGKYLMHTVTEFSHAFPFVNIYCESGNHGRDKLQHEGRAVEGKANSYEWPVFEFLQMATSTLKNVTWNIPKAPYALVKLFDKVMFMTHGDTELKLKSPTRGFDSFEKSLDRMNARMTYGTKVDLLTVGHFHDAMAKPVGESWVIVNGCLVPADGHARTEGYDSTCGQYLWESVPGFPFGDNRFIRVGGKQDRDPELNRIIPAYDYW
jgi:hypothetical protein